MTKKIHNIKNIFFWYIIYLYKKNNYIYPYMLSYTIIVGMLYCRFSIYLFLFAPCSVFFLLKMIIFICPCFLFFPLCPYLLVAPLQWTFCPFYIDFRIPTRKPDPNPRSKKTVYGSETLITNMVNILEGSSEYVSTCGVKQAIRKDIQQSNLNYLPQKYIFFLLHMRNVFWANKYFSGKTYLWRKLLFFSLRFSFVRKSTNTIIFMKLSKLQVNV